MALRVFTLNETLSAYAIGAVVGFVAGVVVAAMVFAATT